MGASVSAVSVERPAITTSAPVASASASGKRADVGVGAEDAAANGGEGRAGIHVAHLVSLGEELVDAAVDVIAQHHRDLQPRRQPHHFARACQRVDAAGIGDHRDAALADLAREPRDERRKIARVAEVADRPAAAFAESTW